MENDFENFLFNQFICPDFNNDYASEMRRSYK